MMVAVMMYMVGVIWLIVYLFWPYALMTSNNVPVSMWQQAVLFSYLAYLAYEFPTCFLLCMNDMRVVMFNINVIPDVLPGNEAEIAISWWRVFSSFGANIVFALMTGVMLFSYANQVPVSINPITV